MGLLYTIIAAVLLLIIAIVLIVPVSVRISARLTGYSGAHAKREVLLRGKARAGLLFGALGLTAYFCAYKSVTGRLEARVWLKGRREWILSLPEMKELLSLLKPRANKPPPEPRQEKPKRRLSATRIARAALDSLKLRGVRVGGVLGTGDAASTALTIGAISGAVYTLLTPKMKKPPRIAIGPDFNDEKLRLELAGIVDVCIGKSTLKLVRGRRNGA